MARAEFTCHTAGMKKESSHTPTRCKFSIFRQLCNLIPNHLVAQLARQTGAEEKSRSFKPWSHVVSLLFAQFTTDKNLLLGFAEEGDLVFFGGVFFASACFESGESRAFPETE